MKSTVTLAALAAMVFTAGCVSQADYDQLMFENRNLLAEKEEYSQRLVDSESQTKALRTQLRSKENELDVQQKLVGNLKAENDRLEQAVATAHDVIGRTDLSPSAPLVIKSPLPPELNAALKNFAAAHPNSVEYDAARGVIKWRSDLLFSSGKDILREEAKSTLGSFARVINTAEASQFEIQVVGHTDSDPIKHAKRFGHPTNWHLSSHRAIAVAVELINAQVSPERIGVAGYAEYHPISDNNSKTGKAQNRRVEIMIIAQPREADIVDVRSSQPAPAEPEK